MKSTHPSIEEQPMQLSQQVKYVGVVLDPKLIWQLHIESQCKKA